MHQQLVNTRLSSGLEVLCLNSQEAETLYQQVQEYLKI